MREFDIFMYSLIRYLFASFHHQRRMISKSEVLDEEKSIYMIGNFVKDWFRYDIPFVYVRDAFVYILKERGLISESYAVQPIIGKKE